MKNRYMIILVLSVASFLSAEIVDSTLQKEIKKDTVLLQEQAIDTTKNDTVITKEIMIDTTAKDTTYIDSTVSEFVNVDSVKTETAFGKIAVTSVPESTVLIFDEINRGKTPVSIDSIIPGKHSIILKKSGYFVKKVSVNIKVGSDAKLNFKLVKPATLILNSSPTNAIISLNGKIVGTTPFVNKKLKPKKYELSLQLSTGESRDTIITLKNGLTDSLYFNFQVVSPNDSLSKESLNQETKEDDKDTKMKKILNRVAIGFFAAFTAVVLLIELRQN